MSHGPDLNARKATPESVNRRLNLYCAAAVASGVSLFALAQPAEGEVVVKTVNITVSAGTPGFIDLNSDGKNDFEFSILRGGYDHSFYRTLAVIPLTGGKPVGGARSPLGPYGSALASGANIGPTAHFSSSVARGQVTLERTNGFVSGSSFYTPYGQWGVTSTSHYLGVKFLISGVTHYGWIQLSVGRFEGFQAFITEVAYETVANKAIAAGATSSTEASSAPVEQNLTKPVGPSLGMLAAGSDALALWRR